MKKSVFFAVLMLASAVLLLFACNKKEFSSPEKEEIPILPQNQALLDLLSNGESISIEDGEGVTFRNQVTIPSQIQVYVTDDRLTFGSQQDVYNFLDYLEYLTDNWDYSNSDQWDDTPQEIEHLGDEALNAVEDHLGYTSLRSHYNLLEWFDENFENSLDFYMDDPEYQMLLNPNHVAQIGSDCYKYVTPTVVAIVANCDRDAMALLDQWGIFANDENIKMIDESTGEPVISSNTKVDERDDVCFLNLKVDKDIDGDFQTINLFSHLVTEIEINGIDVPSSCIAGVLFDIDWGDGFTSSGSDENHTYDVELMAGECKEFTIKVEAIPIISCEDCTVGKEFTEDVKVNICRPLKDCFIGKKTNEVLDFYFTHGGDEWRIRNPKMGQRSSKGFFANEKLWAKTILQKKKNNGKWRRRKPGDFLIARVRQVYIVNECTHENEFDEDKSKKKKRVKVKFKPNQSFGTYESGNLMFQADFQADMGGGHIYGLTNVTLWD